MIKTWQVILATIAIFVAGLVTGGATAFGVARWAARHHGAGGGPFGSRTGGGPMQPFGPQLIRSFENKLDLTMEQRSRIGPIVRRTSEQLGRERREAAAAIERMQDEIAEILTPAQRVEFDQLMSQQRARLKQLRQAPPPPRQDEQLAPPK